VALPEGMSPGPLDDALGDAPVHAEASGVTFDVPAGYGRVLLLTTEVLAEARGLYAAAGYRVVEERAEGARRDFWMEKELMGAGSWTA